MITLTDQDIEAAYFLSAKEIRRCQLADTKPDPWVEDLFSRLDAWMMSAPGPDMVGENNFSCESGDGGTAMPESQPGLLSARQLADRLGCTPRHIRRIADRFGGIKIDQRWMFPAQNTTRKAS
jgi:hypothetical protein